MIIPDEKTQKDRYIAGVTLFYNTRLWPDHNLEVRAISNGRSPMPPFGAVEEQTASPSPVPAR